ncbi:MAG: 6-pyruvoyl-tetrahydropterin synthase-related protein, partial [Anaerolineae bacterium]
MRSQRIKQIGLFVTVVLLTGVALTPLLRADAPCTHDGGLHYFRIVAMRHALGNGLLSSRWSPDLAFGYGYPFFNYRAASSYYLGLTLYLFGLPLPLALNMVYALSLVGSALGAYLLGRDLFGRRAGLVAAVAYTYAPYSFIDALTRGNMPESVALALLPFILWAFRRLLLSGRPRYLLLSSGILALLWLTHNISSLLFTPFLALYLLVVWWVRGRRDYLVVAGVALVLGVGLTAFFWMPAILEMDEVQLHMSRTTRNNDYHFNFVGLSEVLAPPQSADPALLNPPLRLPVGLPLAVLALLGTVLALWRWRDVLLAKDKRLEDVERWANVAFFALASLTMLFMATRASLALWENVPLVPFVQFPWRLVGRATLPLSLLAAALIPALPQYPIPLPPALRAGASGFASGTGVPDTQYPIPNLHSPTLAPRCGCSAGVFILLLILTAIPSTYPPTGYCPSESRPDILDVFAYEHRTGLVGVDPEGSYFPVTVESHPTGSPLEAQYAATLSNREPIARFDSASLPPDGVIHRAEYAPNRARLELETPHDARVRYLAFAFPGWRVLIDGIPTDVVPSDPEGLITFDLPAGRHTVEVAWRSTLVRTAASMLSLLALASVIFIAYASLKHDLAGRIRRWGKARTSPPVPQPWAITPIGALAWQEVALLALLALALLAFKLAVVDRSDTLFRHPGLRDDGMLPGVDVPLDIRFDDGVRLLGYDRSAETLSSDGALHLAFYWSAYTRPQHSYKSTVALAAPDGQLWSPKTAFPRRGYADLPPSPAWGDGRYVVDGLDVEPLPGTPPGRYDLLLTIFDRETLAPLDALDEAGQVAGPNLVAGQITLTRPSHSLDPDGVPVQIRLGSDLGPLTLHGANLDRDEAAPGDPVLVTLFWGIGYWGLDTLVPEVKPLAPARSAGGSGIGDWRLYLGLVGEEGQEVVGWELPPVREDWPTTLWEEGDLWRGQHLLRLPAALESGDYTWRLHLYESTTSVPAAERKGSGRVSEEKVDLGRLRVDAPERIWQAPSLQWPLDAELGDQVTLLGANLEPATIAPSAPLTVTLVWQGRAEMDTSLRVFLHLQGPDGNLLTQSDGEPANWTRPTTGWAPGEIIMDQRTLIPPADAPPGPYTLLTGLYDPTTGNRLPLPNGATSIPIITLT